MAVARRGEARPARAFAAPVLRVGAPVRLFVGPARFAAGLAVPSRRPLWLVRVVLALPLALRLLVALRLLDPAARAREGGADFAVAVRVVRRAALADPAAVRPAPVVPVLRRVTPAVLVTPLRAPVRLALAALVDDLFAPEPRFVPAAEASVLVAVGLRPAVVRPCFAAGAVAGLPLPARRALPLARGGVSSAERVRPLELAAVPLAFLAVVLRVGVLAMCISFLRGSAPRDSTAVSESSLPA